MIFDATVLGRTLRVEVRGSDGHYSVNVDGETHEVSVSDVAHGFTRVRIGAHGHELGLEREGSGYRVSFPGDSLSVELAEAARGSAVPAAARPRPGSAHGPDAGAHRARAVEVGADVVAGQGLVVIEAMKMENELRAPRGGRLLELLAREGQAVEAGALLAVVA